METLSLELKRIRATLPEGDSDKHLMIEELENICSEGRMKPHRILWFVGD